MWTALPDMMVPRQDQSLAMVQGRLLVIDGYLWETTIKVVVLDMSSNTWQVAGEISTTGLDLAVFARVFS